jgi:hypothetical protein
MLYGKLDMNDFESMYQNSFGIERWMWWLSLWIIYLSKYLIYGLGIIFLLGVSIGPFVGLIFGIKQIKVKFKQHKHNKNHKKEIENHRKQKDSEYFAKMDKLLEPHTKKKKHK